LGYRKLRIDDATARKLRIDDATSRKLRIDDADKKLLAPERMHLMMVSLRQAVVKRLQTISMRKPQYKLLSGIFLYGSTHSLSKQIVEFEVPMMTKVDDARIKKADCLVRRCTVKDAEENRDPS
jgi:hypothetical protein